jgi:hypothetical protein
LAQISAAMAATISTMPPDAELLVNERKGART